MSYSFEGSFILPFLLDIQLPQAYEAILMDGLQHHIQELYQTKEFHVLIQVINRVFVVHILLLIQVVEPKIKAKLSFSLSQYEIKTIII